MLVSGYGVLLVVLLVFFDVDEVEVVFWLGSGCSLVVNVKWLWLVVLLLVCSILVKLILCYNGDICSSGISCEVLWLSLINCSVLFLMDSFFR